MNVVDLSFPVVGLAVPRDHGYALYGALCAAQATLHGADWLGVHPLAGVPVGADTLRLGRRSELRVRVPAERIPELLVLAGRRLSVAGAPLLLGAPRVHALSPAASLDARLVAVKLTAAPRRFNAQLGRDALDTAAMAARVETELNRQLAGLGIEGRLSLRGRQRLTVAGRRIVGYSVRVEGLSAEASVLLQEAGLGGRRAMGCGMFRPTRRTA